jgi:8-oxo-dGTP diphosphatase
MANPEDKSHIILVNGIVEKDGEILISQRSFEEAHEPGKWTIPGGKVERTEGNVWNILEESVAREILEETGVIVNKDNIELIANNTFIHSSGKHVVAVIFLCHWKEGEAKALEDTINVKWITKQDVDNLQYPPNVRTYIMKGFERINRV